MTSASRAVRLGVCSRVVVAALAVVATVATAGCAGVGSSTRDAPNGAEEMAVTRASGATSADGRLELGAPWVQLWTKRQQHDVIEECLRTRSSVDACYAAHPVDSRVFWMNARERSELYGYYLTFLDRCLISQGYRVGKVPDRVAFLNTIRDGDPWSPYDGVVVGTRTDWYALSDACPPVPHQIDRRFSPE